MNLSEERCGNCKFFDEREDLCLRYPPMLIPRDKDGGPYSYFPKVYEQEWCGEFKPYEK